MPTTRQALPYGVAPNGYRLPNATRLGMVRLQVADLVRSLAYYQDVLGFRLLERADRRASLGVMGGDRALVELNERPGSRSVPQRGGGCLGLYHFAILLPDRRSLGSFLAHLRTIGVRAGAADHLVSEAVYLSDPDGLGLEVYADRAQHLWRVHNRQLEMTTDHLDVDDLLRAARDTPWRGLPAGTRIGHIHLSVANLQQAEDFYHTALGFDKIVWSYPGALFLSAGGYHHHVGTNTWAADAPAAGVDDARLLEWTLVLPSREEAALVAGRLTAAGYAVVEDGGEWIVDDPWGIPVRIVGADSEDTPS